MNSRPRLIRSGRSGQVLIVAALAIAVLISSTTLYVYELDRNVEPSTPSSLDGIVFGLEQGLKNVMVSSLATVSEGGNSTVLASNMEAFSTVTRDSYGSTLCNVSYTPFEDENYQSGFWLSWNTSSYDVTSVLEHFNLTVQSGSTTVTRAFDLNLTLGVILNTSYSVVGEEKRVNLTAIVNDEEGPAKVGYFTIFYESGGNWTQVEAANLTVVDTGDGVYSLVFVVPSGATSVCLRTTDSRGIRVDSLGSVA